MALLALFTLAFVAICGTMYHNMRYASAEASFDEVDDFMLNYLSRLSNKPQDCEQDCGLHPTYDYKNIYKHASLRYQVRKQIRTRVGIEPNVDRLLYRTAHPAKESDGNDTDTNTNPYDDHNPSEAEATSDQPRARKILSLCVVNATEYSISVVHVVYNDQSEHYSAIMFLPPYQYGTKGAVADSFTPSDVQTVISRSRDMCTNEVTYAEPDKVLHSSLSLHCYHRFNHERRALLKRIGGNEYSGILNCSA